MGSYEFDIFTLTSNVDSTEAGIVEISPDHPTYHYGDEVTMTATASDGFYFC